MHATLVERELKILLVMKKLKRSLSLDLNQMHVVPRENVNLLHYHLAVMVLARHLKKNLNLVLMTTTKTRL
jgi:CII-binding regulator of phage lambda lysogenization HflD